MRKLTDQQARFCEIYMTNGFVAAKAYREAYPNCNTATSSIEAYKLLKNPRIQDELDKLEIGYRIAGYKMGIDKERIMYRLSEMMNATKGTKKVKNEETGEEKEVPIPDWRTINDAITTYAKLTGDFTERKKISVEQDGGGIGEIDPTKLGKEDLEQLREDLLKNL